MARPRRAEPGITIPSAPDLPSPSRTETSIVVGILLLTALALSPCIGNDFIVNWDDDRYVLNNPMIQDLSWGGIVTMFTRCHFDNYHPFTTLSNALEFHLFGLAPWPYHLGNLLLHLVNTWLVFAFARRLSSRLATAAITALFFGLHPMHVESVAWISERKDVLYACFFFASLLCYLRYIRNGSPRAYLASLALFVAALLSKSAAVALAPVLILIDYYSDRAPSLRSAAEKAPFFVLAAAFGFVAIRSQSGAMILAPSFPPLERLCLASYALVFYVVKLFVPTGLSAFHAYPARIGSHLPWSYYAAPLVLALGAVGILWPSKIKKDLLFGSAFYLLTIGLVIQIVPFGLFLVAERYTYVPYVGLLFILGQLYARAIDSALPHASRLKPLFLSVCGVFACLAFVVTFSRTSDWKDSVTLFSKAIAIDPSNYYSYYARGVGKASHGDLQGAMRDYDEAIRLNPDDLHSHLNRGAMKEKTGDLSGAIADYTDTIRLAPGHARAFYNRANVKRAQSDYAGAIQDYSEALRFNPDYPEAYVNRGGAKFVLDDFHGAVADYDAALRLNPHLATALYSRGNAKFKLGDPAAACESWRGAQREGFADAGPQIVAYCQ